MQFSPPPPFGFPEGSRTVLPHYGLPGQPGSLGPQGDTLRRMVLQILAAHGQFASVWGMTVCPDWRPAGSGD